MASEDRYKHTSNTKNTTPAKEVDGAVAKAKATAGDPPAAANPAGAININDPGPAAGHDSTWGEVASRHGRERQDTMDRQVNEMQDMHKRHVAEHTSMGERHASEVASVQPGNGITESPAETANVKGSQG